MTKEVEQFLEKVRKETNHGVLLTRLYYMPSKVLLGNYNVISNAYYTTPDYLSLLINNDLTDFLELAIEDEDFLSRMDLSLYLRLICILDDSIKLKKSYLHVFMKGNLFNRIKIMTGKDLPKLKLLNQDVRAYKKLYKGHFPIEQMCSYDEVMAEKIELTLSNIYDDIYNKTETPKQAKYDFLNNIEEDLDKAAHYIKIYPLRFKEKINTKIMTKLVCENRFLNVVQRLLEEKELEEEIIDNIISIIHLGIQIKTRVVYKIDFYYERMDVEAIKSFDLIKARSLISVLTELKYKSKNDFKLIKGGSNQQ